MQNEHPTKVSRLLEDAEQSIQQGKREKAYRTSLEVTNLAPEEPLGWYLRSQAAPSQEEQLVCLSRVYSLDPNFPPAKGKMYAALAYINETKELYQVKSGLDLLINVPKNRSYDELYLQRTGGPLKAAFSWLNLTLFALFFGGVGAFFLAPLTGIRALLSYKRINQRSDRVRMLIILALAALIWLVSVPLGLLFLMHFMAWRG
jgi:hypothetical protein